MLCLRVLQLLVLHWARAAGVCVLDLSRQQLACHFHSEVLHFDSEVLHVFDSQLLLHVFQLSLPASPPFLAHQLQWL